MTTSRQRGRAARKRQSAKPNWHVLKTSGRTWISRSSGVPPTATTGRPLPHCSLQQGTGLFRGTYLRFSCALDAESASWATPTHEAFMVHAAAAAAARALARAIREYAKRRLIDHYLVEVADSAVAIPRPDISAFTA